MGPVRFETDFAAYLDAIPLGDDSSSDESEAEADRSKAKASKGERRRGTKRPATEPEDSGRQKRLPNTAKKRPAKYEDVAWIVSQQGIAEGLDAMGGLACGASSLWDWRVDPSATSKQAAEGAPVEGAKPAPAEASQRWSPLFCMSRIWAGGWGGQCTCPRLPGSEYCKAHEKQIRLQKYLTHGRIDGPIPPKKRKEFEMWQAILTKRQAQQRRAPSARAGEPSAGEVALDATLNDGDAFNETRWRDMCPGAGESRRAYRYRTGRQLPGTDPNGTAAASRPQGQSARIAVAKRPAAAG